MDRCTKVLMYFFVMLSHLGKNNIANELRQLYSPFFLTGFLFASGYTYSGQYSFKVFFVRKIKQLLMPWFIFSNINIILANFYNPGGHIGIIPELIKNLLQVRTYGDGLWFVNALFVSYIPFYFLIKIYEKKATNNHIISNFLLLGILLFVICSIYSRYMPASIFPWKLNCLPWHIDYVPYALCFMIFGYIFRNYYEERFDIYKSKILLFILVLYPIFVFWNNFYNIEIFFLIQLLLDLITNCLGLLLILIVSKSIKYNKVISYIGQNTLVYFALHGYLVAILERALALYLTPIYDSSILSTVCSLLFGIASSFILLIPTMIINRFFPFAIGKSKRYLSKI